MTFKNKLSSMLLVVAVATLAACGDDKNNPTNGGGSVDVGEITQAIITKADTNATAITIAWKLEGQADSIQITRRDVATGATRSFAIPASEASFTDDTVEDGKTYNYSVRAKKGNNVSAARATVDQRVKAEVELSGDLLGDYSLSAATRYRLTGYVRVQPGGALRIPDGTRVEGLAGSALITVAGAEGKPSGRLFALGTAQRPIIFTSVNATKARGQWGGIVLNGLAPNNGPGGRLIGEGNTGVHGGNNPNDTSGVLRYVRVEYGGTRITADNEINGFTFNSVGAGTVLENLQAHFIADDGFEWFGGTVNAKYLVSTGNDDEAFDFDNSWCGKGQFWVAVQAADIANRGYESDNNADGTDARASNGRATSPTIYNVTMIGRGLSGGETDGMYIRRGSQGRFFNHVVANFFNRGFALDGPVCVAQFRRDSLFVRNSLFFVKANGATNGATSYARYTGFNSGNVSDSAGFAADFNSRTSLSGGAWANKVGDPNFITVDYNNPVNGAMPDLRVQAGSPALTGAATPPNDGFFVTNATYMGAFGDQSTTNWMTGWTTWFRP